MRQPQQLTAILLPLRTAWEGEKSVHVALKGLVEDNSKWTQLYTVWTFKKSINLSTGVMTAFLFADGLLVIDVGATQAMGR